MAGIADPLAFSPSIASQYSTCGHYLYANNGNRYDMCGLSNHTGIPVGGAFYSPNTSTTWEHSYTKNNSGSFTFSFTKGNNTYDIYPAMQENMGPAFEIHDLNLEFTIEKVK